MKSGGLSITLSAAAFLWAGCAAVQVQEVREAPTKLEPEEAVAVVFSREFDLNATLMEESEIAGCLSDAVLKARPTLRIISPEEFRSAAFPDLASEAAPNSLEYLAMLINHPEFRKRIAPLGIRYLISVHGKTWNPSEDSGGCAAIGGPGGGVLFCAILISWDRKTEWVTSIMDLKEGFLVGKMEGSASGQPWFVLVGPVPFLLPLGMPVFTETRACRDLGEAVVKFLAAPKTPKLEP